MRLCGGTEAFEQFFRIMPSDSGMAFILIPHLDPTHKSIMVDLIKRVTKMKVFEARDGMQVEPNTIYVIPPDNDLSILEGRLQLIEPTAPRGQRRPIDYFFGTLAQDQGEKAICIILSGTGSDGSVGLKAIKSEGGMVIVQDPTTAKYDGMPRSAIDTGLVDYILPPDKMPEQLIKYAKMSRVRPVEKRADVTHKDSDLLDKILVLGSHTGHDFSFYNRYAPPCVIINQTYDILYIHGSTGKYLEPAPGEPTLNVLAMAREGLRTQLQFAIRKCLSQRTDVVVDNVRIKVNGNHQFINLFVKPVYLPINEQNLVMILFEDIKPPEGVKQIRGRTKETKKRRSEIQELRQELKYTKEDFQATVEELQTANEEWKSANEELQSANEELQSVNEELETSKEELDSLNEELVTINSELQTKIDELTESNNDMKNLINSTRIATIFLDRDLKVKKFTPETTRIINLIDSDIDCPISHIVSKITNGNLVNDIESVLKTLVLVEKEVRTNDDHWYLMRIPPYRTAEDIIDGV